MGTPRFTSWPLPFGQYFETILSGGEAEVSNVCGILWDTEKGIMNWSSEKLHGAGDIACLGPKE